MRPRAAGQRRTAPAHPAALAQTFPPDLLAETLQVAERCSFSLDELKYQYPAEVVPEGETPSSYLRRSPTKGQGGAGPKASRPRSRRRSSTSSHSSATCGYEHYFLTVYDIVRLRAVAADPLPGRGSAANSVVCYCLGVTEVDPARMSVLFERFISKERNEPPDIDVDFEHERREEVIQYLYGKYGRARAALTAVAITYRPKSAIRDVGKALGLPEETIDALAGEPHLVGRRRHQDRADRGDSASTLDDLAVRQLVDLTGQIMGLPRHLSQHPGGFVLTKGPLSRLVPIENAAMEDRTVSSGTRTTSMRWVC
jgi:error-prone DNA polymerase